MSSLATQSQDTPFCSECRTPVSLFGHYYRKSDRAVIQRYRCSQCRSTFSDATFSKCYRQKKRYLNPTLFHLLTGGYSQRRAALDLGINRKTVVRKFLFLGLEALELLPKINATQPKADVLEFDDMETSEHSKCKPLSITLAVENPTRRIMGFRVSEMPAKGKLASISRKKYGPRPDGRRRARRSLFAELKPLLNPGAVIKSDLNPHYEPDVRDHFKDHEYQQFKGRRGCVAGQGELKRGGFDPLFRFNHTCAMLRANINRLFRRTWCTTKQKERLSLHIAMYALKHNFQLIKS